MLKKVLYCASTTSHLRNFHIPYIKWLSDNKCDVTTLTDDGQPVTFANRSEKAPFTKTLWSHKNIILIFKIKQLVLQGAYHLVITNTTLAGAIVRAAIRLLPKTRRPQVMHICHGFLFNNNDGLKKRLLLIPERMCAKVTDVFVVMNHESERIARDNKLGKKIVHTNGMGLDITKFKSSMITSDIFKFVYVAEFSARKNQAELIRAFANAIVDMPNARLVLAGDGVTLSACKKLTCNLAINDHVDFLGFVSEIPALLNECGAAVSSSRYEGLPFNIMEAMASGLPIIASNIAGHSDLLNQKSLYKDQNELTEMLINAYCTGKRLFEYPNIDQYSLANVRETWIKILNELIIR